MLSLVIHKSGSVRAGTVFTSFQAQLRIRSLIHASDGKTDVNDPDSHKLHCTLAFFYYLLNVESSSRSKPCRNMYVVYVFVKHVGIVGVCMHVCPYAIMYACMHACMSMHM